MARLTLANLQTQVKDYLPGKADAKIARFANKAVREIYREVGPTERGAFNLKAPESTGTVAVTQDSTTVTGTGTAFDNVDGANGGLIQIEGDNTWFPVEAIGGPTDLTLGAEWPGAAASGLTFTLVQPCVLLPATVGDILKVWLAGRHELLPASDELVVDEYGILRLQTPRWFSLRGFGTDGQRRIQVHFPQDARYAVTYVYREAATLYNAGDTSSVTTLPPEWDDLVIAGTLMYGFLQQHKPQDAAYWKSEYRELLNQIKARDLAGYHSRLEPYRMPRSVLYHETITDDDY